MSSNPVFVMNLDVIEYLAFSVRYRELVRRKNVGSIPFGTKWTTSNKMHLLTLSPRFNAYLGY